MLPFYFDKYIFIITQKALNLPLFSFHPLVLLQFHQEPSIHSCTYANLLIQTQSTV